MANYEPGDSSVITFTTKNNAGQNVDPSTLLIYYRDAVGTWTTATYGVTSNLTKVATGVYQLIIYIPNAAASSGTWKYEGAAIDASSNPLTVSRGSFQVGISDRLS